MTKSERRRRTVLIGIRLLPAEHQALKAAADDLEMSLGALIRHSLRGVIGDAK